MNKTSIVLIVLGLLVIGGVIFSLNKKPSIPAVVNVPVANTQTAQENPVVISVSLKKAGPFTPKEYQVQEGQAVVIKVTSDVADELHFHGYDLHTDLTVGQEGTIEFTANKTGRFEFELENEKKTLGVIDVNPK